MLPLCLTEMWRVTNTWELGICHLTYCSSASCGRGEAPSGPWWQGRKQMEQQRPQLDGSGWWVGQWSSILSSPGCPWQYLHQPSWGTVRQEDCQTVIQYIDHVWTYQTKRTDLGGKRRRSADFTTDSTEVDCAGVESVIRARVIWYDKRLTLGIVTGLTDFNFGRIEFRRHVVRWMKSPTKLMDATDPNTHDGGEPAEGQLSWIVGNFSCWFVVPTCSLPKHTFDTSFYKAG